MLLITILHLSSKSLQSAFAYGISFAPHSSYENKGGGGIISLANEETKTQKLGDFPRPEGARHTLTKHLLIHYALVHFTLLLALWVLNLSISLICSQPQKKQSVSFTLENLHRWAPLGATNVLDLNLSLILRRPYTGQSTDFC